MRYKLTLLEGDYVHEQHSYNTITECYQQSLIYKLAGDNYFTIETDSGCDAGDDPLMILTACDIITDKEEIRSFLSKVEGE